MNSAKNSSPRRFSPQVSGVLQGRDQVAGVFAGEEGLDGQGVDAAGVQGQGLLGQVQGLVRVAAFVGLEGQFLGHLPRIILAAIRRCWAARRTLRPWSRNSASEVNSASPAAAQRFAQQTFDEKRRWPGGLGLLGHGVLPGFPGGVARVR